MNSALRWFGRVSLVFLTACSGNEMTHMSQAELLRLINSGQAPLVVDVRTQSEYQASHVPGAIHIPFLASFSTDELSGLSSSELLVIYCEHGPRAGIAKWGLSTAGFKNMRYLEGHMSAWKKAKLPVESLHKPQP